MLDLDTRTAILKLHHQGHGSRVIAQTLRISRNAVKRVLKQGCAEVPALEREERLTAHLDTIRDLYTRCLGNRVRVIEELAQQGIPVGYSTLTAFLRRQGVGVVPKTPSGHYVFRPGEEMQHDTSPHTVTVGGTPRSVHCASLVLCYSRRLYAQVYPRWSRFACKVFLTEAFQAFGALARRCVIDNSSVILAGGSGKDAVISTEMAAFAERFGFAFRAHAVGDANRSARVERPFHYIEHNFYAGRTFADLDDLNRQLRAWCEKVDRTFKKKLGAVPMELFAAERPALVGLPLFVPEVYALHPRRVDVDGYVSVHRNRYSVPPALIGRSLEVHETRDRIRIFDGHRLVTEHQRLEPGAERWVTLPEHRHPRRPKGPLPPLPEERELRAAAPLLGELVDRLRRRFGGQAARAVRQLHRLWIEYPTEPLLEAIAAALPYDLTDLPRLERMVLRRIAGEFFRLPTEPPEDGDE